MVSEEGDESISLLMFAGLFRDDFPWLYEIVMEAYREVRNGDSKAAQKVIERLHKITRAMRRGPFLDEIAGGSKEAHMMMMELPMMLDHFLHRFEARRVGNPAGIEDEESKESAG